MPTYEYECQRCGQVTSEFRSITAPRRQRCPLCRGKVELLISGGMGVVFKGDGFYVNDSRKATGRPADKPATGTDGGSGKAGSAGAAADGGAKPASGAAGNGGGKASAGSDAG